MHHYFPTDESFVRFTYHTKLKISRNTTTFTPRLTICRKQWCRLQVCSHLIGKHGYCNTNSNISFAAVHCCHLLFLFIITHNVAPNIHNNRKLSAFCIQVFPLSLQAIFLEAKTLNSFHFILPKICTQSQTELNLNSKMLISVSHRTWFSPSESVMLQHNTTCSHSQKCCSSITWAHLSYTSISVIKGTPRTTIALCTCTVSACTLHAFSSNWRTRNAETFTAKHGYEPHGWSSRSCLSVHFSTKPQNTLHWNSALKVGILH
jgi:hypothetical protein